MRGFTGGFYNGRPVFVREEYEREWAGRSEQERLEYLTGVSGSELIDAKMHAERVDPRLLYTTKDSFFDVQLRGGAPVEAMWHPYENGYVHEITGEYVITGAPPAGDSCPCWCKNYFTRHTADNRLSLGNALSLLLFAGAVLSQFGKKDRG